MNDYLINYINNYIKTFRTYNNHRFSITIFGFGSFVPKDDIVFGELIALLCQNGFNIRIEGSDNAIASVMVFYTDLNDEKSDYYSFCIDNFPLLIELSSKTDIPLAAIIIMKIIAQLVCRSKILYKAIVLDLDDTLWKGTLAEVGFETIKQRLSTNEGQPFLYFMRFVSNLAKELGVFVAICSRNDIESSKFVIEKLDDTLFPIKSQIDCVIANNNNKSVNIKAIADELSILPESIIFIDDNTIERDEVRKNLPGIFVPEWTNHYELVTLLISICAFERIDMSINAQGRKDRLRILNVARSECHLPALKVSVRCDKNHSEAIRFYAKTNQFKFNKNNIPPCSISLIFTMHRENGESIGECSAISYTICDDLVMINNWAISCAFFKIGLEEFILLYVKKMAKDKILF